MPQLTEPINFRVDEKWYEEIRGAPEREDLASGRLLPQAAALGDAAIQEGGVAARPAHAGRDERCLGGEMATSAARFVHTIYQDDIEDLLRKSHALNDARDAYLEQRDFIKIALESGAQVEPGPHAASLQDIAGGERYALVKPFKRLVVS